MSNGIVGIQDPNQDFEVEENIFPEVDEVDDEQLAEGNIYGDETIVDEGVATDLPPDTSIQEGIRDQYSIDVLSDVAPETGVIEQDIDAPVSTTAESDYTWTDDELERRGILNPDPAFAPVTDHGHTWGSTRWTMDRINQQIATGYNPTGNVEGWNFTEPKVALDPEDIANFDWEWYVNQYNGYLIKQGIDTELEAWRHWILHGYATGWLGSPPEGEPQRYLPSEQMIAEKDAERDALAAQEAAADPDKEWFDGIFAGTIQPVTLADYVMLTVVPNAESAVGAIRITPEELVESYEGARDKRVLISQLRALSSLPDEVDLLTDEELIARLYQEAGLDPVDTTPPADTTDPADTTIPGDTTDPADTTTPGGTTPPVDEDVTGGYGDTGDFIPPGTTDVVDGTEDVVDDTGDVIVDSGVEDEPIWDTGQNEDNLGPSVGIQGLGVDLYDETADEGDRYSFISIDEITAEDVLAEMKLIYPGLQIDADAIANAVYDFSKLGVDWEVEDLEDILDALEYDLGSYVKDVFLAALTGPQQRTSDWIEAGPAGWTPDDWKAYLQLVRDPAYVDRGFSTLDAAFDDIEDQLGVTNLSRNWRDDPRFWAYIDSIRSPDGTVPRLDKLPKHLRDGLLDLLKGDSYTVLNDGFTLTEDGWVYTEPFDASIEGEYKWGTEADDQARVDYLGEVASQSALDADWNAFENAKHIKELREKLRWLGFGGDYMDEISKNLLSRIDDGLLSDDEIFISFMDDEVEIGPDGTPRFGGMLNQIKTLTEGHPDDDEDEEEKESRVDLYSAYLTEKYPDSDIDPWLDTNEYIEFLYSLAMQDGTGNVSSELLEEIERANANLGKRRPTAPGTFDEDPPPEDSKYLESDYGGVDGVGGINDPFAMAGHGLYAPGRLFGSEAYSSQSAYGDLWSLVEPEIGELEDISDEEIALFTKADDFFTWLREDAMERNLWSEGEAFDAYSYINALRADPTVSDEEVAEFENQYQYYGNIWNDIAPRYYPDAQRAAMQYYGTPAQEDLGDELAQKLLPYAPVFADYLNRQGIVGPDGGPLSLDDVIAILSSEGMSGLAPPTDAGAEGQTTGGGGASGIGSAVDVSQGAASSEATAVTTGGVGEGTTQSTLEIDPLAAADNANVNSNEPLTTVEHNSNQPVNFTPSVVDGYEMLSGNIAGTRSARRETADDLSDLAKSSSKAGGFIGSSGAADVYVPNFIMDAQGSASGKVSPVSWWMGLGKTEKDTIRNMVSKDYARMGYSSADEALDESVGFRNPEGDLYRTEGDVTNFYVPRWAAEAAYNDVDEGGSELLDEFWGDFKGYIPSYSWWQSIGVENREELQQRVIAEYGDDKAELVAIKKMEVKEVKGRDVAYVANVKGFKNKDGELVPEWETPEELDRTINSELRAEPVTFTDFVKWMIDASGGELDPLTWVNGQPALGYRANFDIESQARYIALNPVLENGFRRTFGLEEWIPNKGGRINSGDSKGVSHTRKGEWIPFSPEGHPIYTEGARYASDQRDARYGYDEGASGALSRTAWEYFLDHWDDFVGPENARKSPWPQGVSKTDVGDTEIPRYLQTNKWIGGGWGSQNERLPLWSPDFSGSAVRGTRTWKDMFNRDDALFDIEMDDFFHELSKRDPETGVFRTSTRELINFEGDDYEPEWGDPETWGDYEGERLATGDNYRSKGSPLYYDDGSSAQAIWAALSTFIPYFEEYNQSYELASEGIEVASFEKFLNSGYGGERPEFDRTDIVGSAESALAFQQNSKVQYEGYVNSMGYLPEWQIGKVVSPNVKYVSSDLTQLFTEIGKPPGESFTDGVVRPMFYYHDMSSRINAPGNISSTYGSPQFAEGGIVDLARDKSVPEENVSARESSPLMNKEDLEGLVAQDPLLQDLMSALVGDHPDSEGIISQAISKYGQEIVNALARLVQRNVGSQSPYVSGPDSGMADSVPVAMKNAGGIPSLGDDRASISHGEFVVPADVVAHLGDGNNENGASKLHGMMDRVRDEKTGSVEQPGEIVEEEVLPA